ncbi:hypothetical protein AALO_G00038590, partial [Alosa alosa]
MYTGTLDGESVPLDRLNCSTLSYWITNPLNCPFILDNQPLGFVPWIQISLHTYTDIVHSHHLTRVFLFFW